MTSHASLRLLVASLAGSRAQIARTLSDAKESLSEAQREAHVTDVARSLLQRASLLTQQQVRYRVTTLGTMAMGAIFPEPVALDLQFRENRGKTEARLLFSKEDEAGINHTLDPLEEDSGGACNVAGMALRVSMREAQVPGTRPIVVLDEPLNHVNDPTREIHRKAAELIQEVGNGLGIQFLIVTMVPELAEIGEPVQLGVSGEDEAV